MEGKQFLVGEQVTRVKWHPTVGVRPVQPVQRQTGFVVGANDGEHLLPTTPAGNTRGRESIALRLLDS